MTGIELLEISNDSLSVRALEFSGNTFWFAGNKGSYGSIIDSSKQLTKGRVIYEGNESLEFRSIAVTDNFTFILTAGNPGLIYRISHENDSLALVYKEVGETVFYDSLKFWNDNEGIAMGDPQDGCFTILMTKDGGNNWDKVPCEALPNMIEGEAAFAASNSNIAINGNHIWIVTGGAAARVWHSADKGKSWQVMESPISQGGAMTGIYAVDFYDENLGVIMGGDWNAKEINTSNKAITRDGGKTWSLLADGVGPGYSSDISFVPGTQGQELLAVGTPGIWWSSDQGENWIQLSESGFYTAAFSQMDEGVLAGNNLISSFRLIRK
ncbi:probable oxidoreductase [Nonlabens marinus S1-08]|uniref:Probable oxidoreductase n=1 Tax=Nonlabens marinus S1-08 TaxID=1454201 RepID=W8VSK5_9FLAO|nr:probable oxidoreductase [Nonlabens marinus S1-08]